MRCQPLWAVFRLGLTATHPHAKWCVVVDSNCKKEEKKNERCKGCQRMSSLYLYEVY